MKTRFHALLLLLASLPLTAPAETPSAPQKKDVALKLTANSTREDVKAALAAQGVTVNEAQLDGVMKQIAAKKSQAKPLAPTPATSAKAGALRKLTEDSSDDDIRAALAARSLEVTESRVGAIAAMLGRVRKPAAKTVETTVPGHSAAKPSDALRAALEEMPGMDLEFNPHRNLYRTPTLVNGVPALFSIDSGAFNSGIATEFCRQLGVATQADGTSKGIGGETAGFRAHLESLVVGPNIRMTGRNLDASAMNTVTVGGGEACDGLVGADLLSQVGAIIDYRTHRLCYPAPDAKKTDIAARAQEAGYRAIPLKAVGGYSLLETSVNGEPVRLVVDTGAQETVLDSGTAARIGLKSVESGQFAAGIGDKLQKLSVASIDNLPLADGVSLHRTPVSVMPLDHLQGSQFGRIDGILGADFFHASGLVFDVAGHTFYLKPGKIDGRASTSAAGEMFSTDTELKKAYDATPRVLAARVKNYGVTENTTKDSRGGVWRAVMVTVKVMEAIKGPAEVGSEESFFILMRESECDTNTLRGLLGRNPAKLLFLGPKAEVGKQVATVPFSSVWNDGPLARAQLKRIRK